jgi:hypothetical protein
MNAADVFARDDEGNLDPSLIPTAPVEPDPNITMSDADRRQWWGRAVGSSWDQATAAYNAAMEPPPPPEPPSLEDLAAMDMEEYRAWREQSNTAGKSVADLAGKSFIV